MVTVIPVSVFSTTTATKHVDGFSGARTLATAGVPRRVRYGSVLFFCIVGRRLIGHKRKNHLAFDPASAIDANAIAWHLPGSCHQPGSEFDAA